MYQLGDRYWEEFFPRIVPILLANQQADGSWPADSQKWDATVRRSVYDSTNGNYARHAKSTDSNLAAMRLCRNNDDKSYAKRCGVVAFLMYRCPMQFRRRSEIRPPCATEKQAARCRAAIQQKRPKAAADDTPTNVLAPDEWKRVDAAVERSLSWMASQQQAGRLVSVA